MTFDPYTSAIAANKTAPHKFFKVSLGILHVPAADSGSWTAGVGERLVFLGGMMLRSCDVVAVDSWRDVNVGGWWLVLND